MRSAHGEGGALMGPPEGAESSAVAVSTDTGGRVADDLPGKLIEFEPVERVSLVGFAVDGLADPAGGFEKDPETGFEAGSRERRSCTRSADRPSRA